MVSKYEKWINEITWHSSLDSFLGKKKICKSLPYNKKAKKMFIATGSGELLIHKTSKALWKISEDGKSIEPVFDTDVLTEEDMKDV